MARPEVGSWHPLVVLLEKNLQRHVRDDVLDVIGSVEAVEAVGTENAGLLKDFVLAHQYRLTSTWSDTRRRSCFFREEVFERNCGFYEPPLDSLSCIESQTLRLSVVVVIDCLQMLVF